MCGARSSACLRRKHLTAAFVKDKLPPCLPLETDPRHPLVARFLKSVGQRKPEGVRYFCDASVLGHGGIPSVVFGPGDIAQAHTADEWISARGTGARQRAAAALPAILFLNRNRPGPLKPPCWLKKSNPRL